MVAATPDIVYRSRSDVTLPQLLRRARGLVFSGYRRRLGDSPPARKVVTIAAWRGERAVGLAVLDRGDTAADLRLQSLVVTPRARGRGIGRQLLQEAADLCRGSNIRSLDTRYREDVPAAMRLARLLPDMGWSEPRPHLSMCRTTMPRMQAARWVRNLKIPKGYAVFPWHELDAGQRAAIVARAGDWYPAVLDPFKNEAEIARVNSLGLRRGDEVVGWSITHRAGDGAIQYSSLFVDPPLQKLGRALPLLAESIRRQAAAGVPVAQFQVEHGNPQMQAFLDRHLRRYLIEDIEVYSSRLDLA